jgi:RNA recognition motif-containing protein
MNKKLFVGRLPFEFSDAQLSALFTSCGTVVAAAMVPDPKTGRTRGFGFVDMSTEAEAQAAIQANNGKSLGDKKIWVTLAREKGPAPAPRPSFNKEKPRAFEGGPKRRPRFDENRFGGGAPPRRGPGHFTEQRSSFAPKKNFSGNRGPMGGSPENQQPFQSPEQRRFGPKRPSSAGPSSERSGPPSRFPNKTFRPSGHSRGGPSRGGPSRGGPSRGGPSRGGPSRGGPAKRSSGGDGRSRGPRA